MEDSSLSRVMCRRFNEGVSKTQKTRAGKQEEQDWQKSRGCGECELDSLAMTEGGRIGISWIRMR